MISVKRPKIQVTRGMVAMCLICVLMGGVAALMVLSNTRSASFTLYTGLPLQLSWTDDPSNGFIVVGADNTGVLNVTNAATVAFSNIRVVLTITCPAGITSLEGVMYVVLNGVAFLGADFTGGSGTWTRTSAVGAFSSITAGAKLSWDFTFKLMSGETAYQGTWTVGIYIQGDPPT